MTLKRYGYSLVTALVLCATGAYAQSPAPADDANVGGLEEVIVTARKREEKLQDVPLSVTAFTAEQIARDGIKDIEDAIAADPSLNFDTGFAPYDTRIVIRGLSPTRGRPNVATLVDGVDVSSEAIGVAGGSLLINPKLLDIERIELVKGPQSALYGRSAFAGAVSYTTKDPAKEFEAMLGAEVGNLSLNEYRLELSAPIIADELGFRMTAIKYDKDGAYRNLITGANVGGSEGEGVAFSTKWQFSDALSAKLRYEYSHDAFAQAPQAFLPYNTVNEIPAAASQCNGGPIRDARCATITNAAGATLPNVANILETVTGNRGYFTDARIPGYRGSLGSAAGLNVLYTPDFARSTDGGRTAPDYAGSDRNVNRASLVINWDVSFGTFSSLTGYTDADVFTAIDLDKFALRDPATGRDVSGVEQNLTTTSETWQNSQELRFTSDFDSPFNFIAGLQYWKEKSRQVEENYTVIAQGERCQIRPAGPPGVYAELFPGSCGGTAPMFGINGANVFSSVTPFGGIGQYIDDIVAAKDATFVERTVKHQSAYLQLTWEIAQGLSTSIEARYVDEDNTLTGADPIESTAPPPAGFGEPLGSGPGTVTLCGSNGPCIPRTGTGPTAVGVPNGPRGFGPVRPVVYKTFKRNDSYVTPRFSLDWKINEDLLAYVSYAFGEKPGGFSTVTIGAFGIDANADNRPDDIEFKPEKLKEYELGFKSSWLNRRLILNGALFYEDFIDKQISTQREIGGTLGNVIENVPGGEILGLELAMQWRPLDQLQLALGYTFLDSEYTDFTSTSTGAPEIARVGNCQQTTRLGPCLVTRNGNQFEDTPKHAVVAQATWRDQLGATGLEWFADLATRHQSKRFIEDDNAAWVEAYWLADVRFGLESDTWSAVLFVDNVLDDDTIRNGSTGPGNANANFRFGQVIGAGGPIAAPLIPTLTFANLPDPRTYGLRFSYKFKSGAE
jgi:iron complex outermembrane recepter protein